MFTWHSHAKLSEVKQRTVTGTCARNRPNGYGNSSSWSQQLWLWQCSGCCGGNKLLMIPHPRGRSCLHFLVAFLVRLMLWTMEERPHLSRIRGYVCWCLICRDLSLVLQLDDLYDAVACPTKLFTDVEVKETFLYADVHVLVAEWSTERVPPPSHHQLMSVKSNCPLSVNRHYRTERCALRPSRPRLLWLRTKPTSRNMHVESNVALHLDLYVVISAAIAVRYWRAEHVCGHISKIPCDEVFVEPRLTREVQRSELLNFLRCRVLCVVRSCQKMVRHLLTWLHIFAHYSHMVIWSSNHLCLRVRCCSINTYIIDYRRVLCSFDCDRAKSFLANQMEHWQRTIAL